VPRTLLLAAFLAALVPASSRALESGSIALEVHGGLDKYDGLGLRNAAQQVNVDRKALLQDTSTGIGATALVRLFNLKGGALLELGRPGSSPNTTVVGGLFGLSWSLGPVVLDALAEGGGRRAGDFLKDPAIVSKGSSETWLAYVGLRPGLSVHVGTFPKLILGLWGFARWDLTRGTVPVKVVPAGGGLPVDADYRVGGAQYGAAARLGIEL
jgi:hypothetical protein